MVKYDCFFDFSKKSKIRHSLLLQMKREFNKKMSLETKLNHILDNRRDTIDQCAFHLVSAGTGQKKIDEEATIIHKYNQLKRKD